MLPCSSWSCLMSWNAVPLRSDQASGKWNADLNAEPVEHIGQREVELHL